jgi:N-methylhydantoinase A
MMRAIRAVSVERGRDPRQFALLAFGGNGPLFAAAIAAELGIARVIVPPLPGVFSAFGLLVADAEHHATRSLRTRLDAVDPAQVQSALDSLTEAGAARLLRDGFPPERHVFRRAALARYVGQSSEIAVPLRPGSSPGAGHGDFLPRLTQLFGEEHERNYGFRAPPEEPVELIGLSVIARGVSERSRLPDTIPPSASAVPLCRRAWFRDTGWIDTPVVSRAQLTATPRPGPLIVQEYDATCLVPQRSTAALDHFGNIRLALGG